MYDISGAPDGFDQFIIEDFEKLDMIYNFQG